MFVHCMEQKFQDAMNKLKEITTVALPKVTPAIFSPCQRNSREAPVMCGNAQFQSNVKYSREKQEK